MSKSSVVSLFSGLGGIDYGLEAAGFKSVFTTDLDEDCCATIAANRKWHVECSDVAEIDGDLIFEKSNIDYGECGLLVGGPPCQPFSKSGYGKEKSLKGLKDRRSNTIGEFYRVAQELAPRAFMIENVPQFLSSQSVLKYLERQTAELNLVTRSKYKLNFVRLNCADYGVPQLRQRVFIIASRDGKEFKLPPPIFGETANARLGIKRYRSSWDALSRVKQPKVVENLAVGGQWGKLLSTIPAGQNYLWHTDRGGGKPIFGWRSRFWHFLLKLHPDLPSWTIPASPGIHTGPFHWENRRLNLKELSALQTLPADLEIVGSITSAKRQIGNAVPSAIAEYLGIEIRRQLLDSRPRRADRLVPPRASRPVAIDFY